MKTPTKTAKSRYILAIILSILLLIVLDQGAKLAVDLFYEEPEGIMQVNHTFHIHRIFNDSDALEAAARAEETGLPYGFWMAAHVLGLAGRMLLLLGLIFFVDRFFLWDAHAKRYPKLTAAWLSLTLSATLCHFADDLFRGGCPDFLCVARDHPSVSHAVLHSSFDFKDLFMALGRGLFFVLFLLWLIQYVLYVKRDEKGLIEKLRHPIQNIKAAFGRSGGGSEPNGE